MSVTVPSNVATFRIDPRIAEILGESYRSSEQAIKELVDNAWDADAATVKITLPAPMTSDPIIIEDNGSGMTAAEVNQEYLHVGRNRRISRGEKTQKFNRVVKGRKGIGKFAGLMVADLMELTTRARGVEASFRLRKSDLLNSSIDIEEYEITVVQSECPLELAGTTIVLRDLNQSLNYPASEKLKAFLIREYGRENDICITVNGEAIGVEDMPGQNFEKEVVLPCGVTAKLKFTVAEGKRKVPDSGIAVRMGGKVVGNPQHFGLEKHEVFPKKLAEKVYGEVELPPSAVDCVTADGGGFIENHRVFQELSVAVSKEMESGLEEARGMEVRAAKARYQRFINQKLEKLPEYRREFATKALDRVLQRFYLENEERFDSIISVVLDSMEHDEYWQVMQRLDAARDGEVAIFADALVDFGLVDLSLIARQADHRRQVLLDFQKLIDDPSTLEANVHKVLESNLWILASDGELISSNRPVQKIVEEYLEVEYKGERALKRPDLLVSQTYGGRHTIVELKRPSHTITRQDETQALQYRDDLCRKIQDLHIVLLGKARVPEMPAKSERASLEFLSYAEFIGKASSRIDWLLQELNQPLKT